MGRFLSFTFKMFFIFLVGGGGVAKVGRLRGGYLNSGFLAWEGKRSSIPCRFFRINISIPGDFS